MTEGGHLVYVLCRPEVGEVQREVGVEERGSWALRVRNLGESEPVGGGAGFSEE